MSDARTYGSVMIFRHHEERWKPGDRVLIYGEWFLLHKAAIDPSTGVLKYEAEPIPPPAPCSDAVEEILRGDASGDALVADLAAVIATGIDHLSDQIARLDS